MSLQSVSKTILVLETFLTFPDGLASVSQLARKLDWSRAATHQYVSTLAEVGWLVQNEKRDYQLSPRAALFGRFAIEYSGVPHQVSQAMAELVDTLNEPISYAVLNGNEAIIIERHEPKRPFSMTAEPHLELRTSASGMVLLAFDAHLDRNRFAEMTETFDTVRAQGYAQSHSEWLGDVVDVVAVPIMSRGECLGALSVIAPDGRLDIPRARKELLAARMRIEEAVDTTQTSPV
ncbi:IclR family transcriptional regulator [Brevibacterium oceani]|uniref:IclR family transcriptional regulator n=1 Tax=Brevibacterium oceani TaxID=358099 RepID=UPI0015E78E15|nr:helix-turn-helix domain-containing protein [Brevibacterium oceani]